MQSYLLNEKIDNKDQFRKLLEKADRESIYEYYLRVVGEECYFEIEDYPEVYNDFIDYAIDVVSESFYKCILVGACNDKIIIWTPINKGRELNTTAMLYESMIDTHDLSIHDYDFDIYESRVWTTVFKFFTEELLGASDKGFDPIDRLLEKYSWFEELIH